MTPVDQLIIHDPEHGMVGDCFRACIASLLDMQTAELPHFMVKADGTMFDSGDWLVAANQWLRQFDVAFMEFALPDDDVFRQWLNGFDTCGVDMYHTLCGPSPRFAGAKHCVVARNGVAVHDPHPDRTGLAGTPNLIGFLWSLNQAPRFHSVIGAAR